MPSSDAFEGSIPGDRHRTYGLRQYHGSIGKQISISWTGSVRDLLEADARRLLDAGHPHGVIAGCFTPDTVVHVRKRLEARALYCELTRLLGLRSLDARQRKSLHRVRDELEEAIAERIDAGQINDRHGEPFTLELLKTPVDVDAGYLERAREQYADPSTLGRGELEDLTSEHPLR